MPTISADDIIPMVTGHVVMHERPGDPLSGQPIVLCAYLIRHPGAACSASERMDRDPSVSAPHPR
jgi:hypothetical protein